MSFDDKLEYTTKKFGLLRESMIVAKNGIVVAVAAIWEEEIWTLKGGKLRIIGPNGDRFWDEDAWCHFE
jgi:hypothetical protein